MRLTLGPIFFNWDAGTWRDFYFRIADEAEIDTVHIGEVVCSKRAPFVGPHLEAVINRLCAAGKEVVFASLALITSAREVQAMNELCTESDFLVEANDVGLLRALNGRPHIIGPFINTYNTGTAAYFVERGARRICLPPELPLASIAQLASDLPIEIEVIAFGRLPLAISARCFHARAHHLHKDGCQFVCGRDAEGLAVETLDGWPFLAVNGTQTLSYSCCSLLGDIAALRAAGVARLRLSPMRTDMAVVARLFRAVIEERLDAEGASAALAAEIPALPLSNGFLRGREGRAFLP